MHSSPVLIGKSAPMQRLRALIAKVACTSLPVLLQGETGVGKEVVARLLHAGSGRTGPLVATNVCAIADTMFEATLFGHVRGAFTGAVHSSAGYLTEASGGTLFLDEIGGLPLAAQAKLLRAVELKEFRPVGADSDRRSDFRLVAATNEDLWQSARGGTFRQDLFQRLNGLPMVIPPLRERREDVPFLAEHFLGQLAQATSRPPARLDAGARSMLYEYDWPGNVRELRQVLECATALVDGPSIGRGELTPLLTPKLSPVLPRSRRSHQEHRLVEAMRSSDWNVDLVAEQLGIHRATVYRRLRRIGAASPDAATTPPRSSSSTD